MWLNLDMDGITFRLQIRNYTPTIEETDSNWCRVDLSLRSGNWLNYLLKDDELLFSYEVDTLLESLENLLNDKIEIIQEMECIEPDFKFIFHPKTDLRNDPRYIFIQKGYEIEDGFMEWNIIFWNGGITDNFISIHFDRQDITNLVCYLNLVVGKIDIHDEKADHLINKGTIII